VIFAKMIKLAAIRYVGAMMVVETLFRIRSQHSRDNAMEPSGYATKATTKAHCIRNGVFS